MCQIIEFIEAFWYTKIGKYILRCFMSNNNYNLAFYALVVTNSETEYDNAILKLVLYTIKKRNFTSRLNIFIDSDYKYWKHQIVAGKNCELQ